ncbi:PREDICTED: polynucleotide 5'-hydroxyl-kinase NOL9-like [Tarenaya hassleriana]|uniref:polynucleotide 5'-hydroxyl-kinase NOL9-like n=1 Tax=Tarenaya hassleriana TaxID=28532 RepID=UPI00053C6F81|nr:PREDICTED: polynucleotide 5'-hydroxyl-kinase NOL9-like [Tarenaya hassleriana]XP_010540304.1 PREDICTED: polynucleotide 5'-hydroxyl-kinase NOL9-like [Tarenaya hassleriana]
MSETERELPYVPDEWSEAVNSIANSSIMSAVPPVALVCGPKNSGKSTFSRVLVEVLLQRYKKIAYLDTDVGQPEFTAPGFISLTVLDKSILDSDMSIPCVKTPDRCFFFGDLSPKRDPKAYLRYIFTLYDYYQLHFSQSNESKTGLPLVVNTPGWVKGIGYDMLVDMLRYVSPTHVVKVNISAETKNLPAGLFWLDGNQEETINLMEIGSAYRDSFNRSVLIQKDTRLMRDMRIIAYFKQCIRDKEVGTIKELAHELASHTPYEVPISSIKIEHLHFQIPSSEVLYSLNATIVGLGVSSDVFEDLPPCVGLGLVRGIDMEKGVLYVITPVAEHILQKVDLILQGCIQIPTCLLEVREYRSPYISTNVLAVS